MRLHSETSVRLLDDTTTVLGHELRHFANVTCLHFRTRETQAEYEKRKRTEARRQHTAAQTLGGSSSGRALPSAPAPVSGPPPPTALTSASGPAPPTAPALTSTASTATVPSSGRRPQTFNLSTIKMHFLGDYTWFIKSIGTTDSYTSQIVSVNAEFTGAARPESPDIALLG